MCFILYMIQLSVGVGSYTAVLNTKGEALQTLFLCRQITHIGLVAGISLVKVSVAFFLLRLATARSHTWFLWSMIVFLITFTFVCWGTLVSDLVEFSNTPLTLPSDFPMPSSTSCMGLRAPTSPDGHRQRNVLQPRDIPPDRPLQRRYVSPLTHAAPPLTPAVTNIITDFTLALLPVPLIWTLQMKRRARISLVLILGLGAFAAVAGIVRQLITPDFKKAEPWIDDSYTMWNFTEMYAGIIAASLPGMKPLFAWFYDTALSRRPGGNSAYKTPDTLGYRRQTRLADQEAFALEPYAESQTVQVTTKEKAEWEMERAKCSEESILCHARAEEDKRGIRVTHEVQIA
jgi:hypothetical protein